jgi:hypothetical protein
MTAFRGGEMIGVPFTRGNLVRCIGNLGTDTRPCLVGAIYTVTEMHEIQDFRGDWEWIINVDGQGIWNYYARFFELVANVPDNSMRENVAQMVKSAKGK